MIRALAIACWRGERTLNTVPRDSPFSYPAPDPGFFTRRLSNPY
jgi:hypothetical protein